MLEGLDQNSRRRWSSHCRWCIQSSDADSAVAISRSLEIQGVIGDVRTSRGGRRRRNPNRLDLPAGGLPVGRHSLLTPRNVVMVVVVAGCAASHHQEYLQRAVLQVHLHLRRHGRRCHGNSDHRETSLPDHLDRLGREAWSACRRRDPGANRSVMASGHLDRTEAYGEKASVSTLVVVAAIVFTAI